MGLEEIGHIFLSGFIDRIGQKWSCGEEDSTEEESKLQGRITLGLCPCCPEANAMSSAMSWQDSEDLALALLERFPDLDPLQVRFTDLHRWVTELPGFTDDPQKSNEGILERIQMAWYEEYQEVH